MTTCGDVLDSISQCTHYLDQTTCMACQTDLILDITNNKCIYQCQATDSMCSVDSASIDGDLVAHRACKKSTDSGLIAG